MAVVLRIHFKARNHAVSQIVRDGVSLDAIMVGNAKIL
jgi:hypothetical protein